MVSAITLGVSDLNKSTAFYESLGFAKSRKSSEHITWFRTGATVLSLYPLKLLAKDAMVDERGSGFRGLTLAVNMRSRQEVDDFIKNARSAGAKIVKEPQDVFWGGYSSYFKDLDGHLWEVAWNPYTPVDEKGLLSVED